MAYKQGSHDMALVESSVDGQRYLVRNLPDKQDAADRLARTRAKLLRLMRDLKQSDPEKPFVKQMVRNFDADPSRFSESAPDASYTSYSVNKGEKVVLCVRHKDDSFVDENTLMYVAVHELGHLMTEEVGHTDAFWANFRRLLEEAEALGMYRRVDYAAKPAPYCGIDITSTVLQG
jgi:hypothetical protein